jgi:hypothetical protein
MSDVMVFQYELYNELGHLFGLLLVPLLVLGVHGDEPQHEQIEAGSHDGQPEQDEDECEHHVRRLAVQRVVPLQRHHVSEPWGPHIHHLPSARFSVFKCQMFLLPLSNSKLKYKSQGYDLDFSKVKGQSQNTFFNLGMFP